MMVISMCISLHSLLPVEPVSSNVAVPLVQIALLVERREKKRELRSQQTRASRSARWL
jgi:hypothetical protein